LRGSNEIFKEQNNMLEEKIKSIQFSKNDDLIKKYNLELITKFVETKLTDLPKTFEDSLKKESRVKLKQVQSRVRYSRPPNDKFLLMILCSQAKLENDNRGINVKRDIKTKYDTRRLSQRLLFWKGSKKVFVDEERAPIIKEVFERVAAGASSRAIHDWMKDINFRTKNGKLMVMSIIYRMLNNLQV
jgi:Recombinase